VQFGIQSAPPAAEEVLCPGKSRVRGFVAITIDLPRPPLTISHAVIRSDISEHIEEKNRNNLFIMDSTANPAPLGLCAFGMTTMLLSLHNAGLTALSSTILAMALLYGGLAQVIVGIMEWKKNNSFGMITFGSFGFFWISFATLLTLPALGLAKAPAPVELAAFLGVWGIFAVGLFICTLKMHKVLQVTLFAVVALVVLLVAAQLTGNSLVLNLGGVVGIIAGALALYIGIGQVINEVHGRKIFPV
jgi:succinate-acetate transporter protein